VGTYKQFGFTNDLTPAHVTPEGDGLRVEGPAFTSELRVRLEFIQTELGAWGADAAFTVQSDEARFAQGDVKLVPLDIGETPVFTSGHPSQILLTERPMWVSAYQDAYAGNITLELSDGDSSGQAIYISKAWLWERGIHRPEATHEDGSSLVVNVTEDGFGFMIDVHHFSYIVLHPSQISVLGKLGSDPPQTHQGQKRWFESMQRLEVDVGGPMAGSYMLYVEKDWVNLHVPWVGLRGHTWQEATVGGIEYLAIALSPPQTPTIIVFEPFTPTGVPTYTRGNPGSILLHAVNDLFFNASAPMLVHVAASGPLDINVGKAGPYRLRVANAWLAARGVSEPHFRVDGLPTQYLPWWDDSGWSVALEDEATVRVLDGVRDEFLRFEALAQAGVVVYQGNLSAPQLTFPAIYSLLTPSVPSPKDQLNWVLDLPDICQVPGACGISSIELAFEGGPPPAPPGHGDDSYWEVPPEWPDAPPPTFTIHLNPLNGGIDPLKLLDDVWSIVVTGSDCPSGCDIVLPVPGLPDVPELPGIPDLPVPVPPLPLVELIQASVVVFFPEGGSAPAVANPLLFGLMLPNGQGELSFTIYFLVEGRASGGQTIRLKVESDQLGTVEFVETVPPRDRLVAFRSVPARLDAIYKIGIEESLDLVQPFQELLPDFPVNNDPCNQMSLTREFRPDYYDRGWLKAKEGYDAQPRELALGGWTHFWTWGNPCMGFREFTSEFGFGFRGQNLVWTGHEYSIEFGGGLLGAFDPPSNHPHWPGYGALMGSTTFFHRRPVVQGQAVEMVFYDSRVGGSSPYTNIPAESCTSTSLGRAALAIISAVPYLGFLSLASLLVPDSFCQTHWSETDVWKYGEGKVVEVGMEALSDRAITGAIRYKYGSTAMLPEFQIELIGNARYWGWAYPTSESGGHYYEVTPSIRLLQG
jgi:hypothetical protein